MTNPTTPEGVISDSARRIAATRDATRKLSEEIHAKRIAAPTDDQVSTSDQGGQG